MDYAVRGDSSKVRSILTRNSQAANFKDSGNMTALMRAAYWKHCEVVEVLLEYNANVNIQGHQNRTALMMAAQEGSENIVEILLAHSADVNIKDKDNETALTNAARNNKFEIVTILLKHNANVDTQGKDNQTALMTSCNDRFIKVIQTLLNYKADINIKNNDGCTALMIAARNWLDIVELILNHDGVNIGIINLQDNQNNSALIWAARQGKADIVKTLINYRADLNITDNYNRSALLCASRAGFVNVVDVIIRHCDDDDGLDIEIRDTDGKTAMDYLPSITLKLKEIREEKVMEAAAKIKETVAKSKGLTVELYEKWICLSDLCRCELRKDVVALRGFVVDVNAFILSAQQTLNDNDIDNSMSITSLTLHEVKCNAYSVISHSREISQGEEEDLLVFAVREELYEIIDLIFQHRQNSFVDLKQEDRLVVLSLAMQCNNEPMINALIELCSACMIQFLKSLENSEKFLVFISAYDFTSCQSRYSLLTQNHHALWIFLIQIHDETDGDDIIPSKLRNIVLSHPHLAEAIDDKGRLALDIASLRNKLAIKSIFLWFGKYRITESRPEHISETCYVYKAVDESSTNSSILSTDSDKPMKSVCLKLMRYKSHFKRELSSRSHGFDLDSVINIIEYFPSATCTGGGVDDDDGLDSLPEDCYVQYASTTVGITIEELERKSHLTKTIAEKMYCIVMPLADRNMFVSMKQERYAGIYMDEVKHIFKQLLTCVQHIHSRGILHGDIKPLNIVRHGSKWKLIDLDAACVIGIDAIGEKYSTAHVPPEALTVHITDGVQHVCMVRNNYKNDCLLAHPSFDVWSLGCILYQLCNVEVLPLFTQVSQDDNLTNDITRSDDNLQTLHDWTNEIKTKKIKNNQ